MPQCILVKLSQSRRSAHITPAPHYSRFAPFVLSLRSCCHAMCNVAPRFRPLAYSSPTHFTRYARSLLRCRASSSFMCAACCPLRRWHDEQRTMSHACACCFSSPTHFTRYARSIAPASFPHQASQGNGRRQAAPGQVLSNYYLTSFPLSSARQVNDRNTKAPLAKSFFSGLGLALKLTAKPGK